MTTLRYWSTAGDLRLSLFEIWSEWRQSPINGLNLAGPALVAISLDGVEDVELFGAQPGGRRLRQPEVHLPMAKLAVMQGELATALQEQFDVLWQMAGWGAGSPSFTDGAWASYGDERNYGTA